MQVERLAHVQIVSVVVHCRSFENNADHSPKQNRRSKETPDADADQTTPRKRRMPQQRSRIRPAHSKRHFVLIETGRLQDAVVLQATSWASQTHVRLSRGKQLVFVSCYWIRPPDVVSGRTQRGLSPHGGAPVSRKRLQCEPVAEIFFSG